MGETFDSHALRDITEPGQGCGDMTVHRNHAWTIGPVPWTQDRAQLCLGYLSVQLTKLEGGFGNALHAGKAPIFLVSGRETRLDEPRHSRSPHVGKQIPTAFPGQMVELLLI